MTERPAASLSRRTLLLGSIALPSLAVLIASCGDPDVEPAGTPETGAPDTSAVGTDEGGSTIEHPTGATDAVLRITYEGGFVAPGYAFVNTPALIVSGDGMAYTPGVMTMQFPGPLVAPITVRTITEEGVQTLLQNASAAGLLATPPEYPRNDMIADAPDTVVTIVAGGGTYVHRAYALGIDANETDPARKALADYVAAATDLTATVGAAALGPEATLEAAVYRFQATPTTEAELAGYDPKPTITDWPTDTGIDLGTASSCASAPAGAVGPTFAAADQNTFFRQGTALYRLAVAPLLPGDTPC
ncbi:MAG: hypothetical protein WD023_07245 [Ilumatobacteraceae bacterium]